jgi:hypothetical protein
MTRLARFGAAALLGLTLLAGCTQSANGSEVSCGLDQQCTVTFDRTVDAKAEVLGIEAKLVSAQDDRVTLEVGGEQLTLTVGETGTDVAGLNVTLESITETQVKLKITK